MPLDPRVYDPIFNLGGQLATGNMNYPSAATGPTGPTGVTGPTGARGPTGPSGPSA